MGRQGSLKGEGAKWEGRMLERRGMGREEDKEGKEDETAGKEAKVAWEASREKSRERGCGMVEGRAGEGN